VTERGYRGSIREALERSLYGRARLMDAAALRRPALIVAPHQDDETLGCGGTIALKRRAGAEVCIVFLTDGSRSHPAMEREKLARIREDAAGRPVVAFTGVGPSTSDRIGFELERPMQLDIYAIGELRRDAGTVYVRPELVVEVAYDHMEGTRFRHTAQWRRWRPDREPASCTYEQLERPVRFDLADILSPR